MHQKNKNIAIDIRMIENTGIGTYIQSMLKRIIELNPKHHFTLLINRKINYKKYFIDFSCHNYSTVEISSPLYSFREQLEIPYKVRNNIDLYWSPHYVFPVMLRTKFIVTVHDIHHIIDTSFNKVIRRIYSYILFWFIKKMSLTIIAVSKFTQQEIINNINIDEPMIHVIYNGLEQSWHSTKDYKINNTNNMIFSLPYHHYIYAAIIFLVFCFILVKRPSLLYPSELIEGFAPINNKHSRSKSNRKTKSSKKYTNKTIIYSD